jgi:ubiquinone/menaquinone biosynthesis C-methylase UbiE
MTGGGKQCFFAWLSQIRQAHPGYKRFVPFVILVSFVVQPCANSRTDRTSTQSHLPNTWPTCYNEDDESLLGVTNVTDELKAKAQAQFGASAAAYATSSVHARGESLALLVELVEPGRDWGALDVGTGAGHTALAFAPHVAHVVATDLTGEMLAKTAELAAERGLTNIETKAADAETLPFENDSFDLVTCRLAFHHFPNSRQAVGEFARVLKPGGVLGFTDNVVVPDKKAAGYYNAYEKLRDPSHHWVYPLVRLQAMFEEAGLSVLVSRQLSKEFEFHAWADRQRASEAVKEKLLDLMRNVPEALEPLFAPRWADDTLYFSLWEAVIVAENGYG